MGKAVRTPEEERRRQEWLKCHKSATYFIYTYCNIYDATQGEWIPFHLWPEQAHALRQLANNRLVAILKARQLGLTWLVLCYILWRMLYRPIFTGVVFSRRETEARYLLGRERLRGVYKRLPDWMKAERFLVKSSLAWQLSNESIVYGFPTTAGDSYTAGLAFVDEADLVPDLDDLMTAVKPTIDGGGEMILVSRSNKDEPNSPFKKVYKGAERGESEWTSIFLPWHARPERDEEWYEEQKLDIFARTGGYDDLHEQYPETAEEALRPAQLSKRFPTKWLDAIYTEERPLENPPMYFPGLQVFREVNWRNTYMVAADPAEGNPNSNDSALHVLDTLTGEEVACAAGKIEPSVLAVYAARLCRYYNNAQLLIERNNHGHVVINVLDSDEYVDIAMVRGIDMKYGWLTNKRGKTIMYTAAADAIRDGFAIIHSARTYAQLQSIEGDTLAAPEGSLDDLATTYALGQLGITELIGATATVGKSPVAGHRG